MTAKKFFKKVGRGLQNAVAEGTKEFGKGVGKVLGPAAAAAIISAAPYVAEAAPALLAFRTGGRVPGKKGKSIKIIAHGGEFILPVNANPTKRQKSIVKKNKCKKCSSKK